MPLWGYMGVIKGEYIGLIVGTHSPTLPSASVSSCLCQEPSSCSTMMKLPSRILRKLYTVSDVSCDFMFQSLYHVILQYSLDPKPPVVACSFHLRFYFFYLRFFVTALSLHTCTNMYPNIHLYNPSITPIDTYIPLKAGASQKIGESLGCR